MMQDSLPLRVDATPAQPAPLPATGPRPPHRGRLAAALLLRRGAQAVMVAMLVGSLSFLMMRLLPGDMAFRIAAGRYGYDMVTAQAADAVRAELGLGGPWLQGLLQWWQGLLRFDLGTSTVTGAPVAEELAHQLSHTLQLALAAVGLGSLFAVPLGLAAGMRAGGTLDRASLALSVLLRALPPFVLGILIVALLSVQLGLLPAGGHGEHGTLIAPALTLALGLAATTLRVARDAMADVAASAYFLFARTKGLSDAAALARHGVRNAAVPLVAYLGVQLVYLVEGVVVVETLFAWPGLGHALVHAIFGRDVPMIQGAALVLALLFVALHAAVDLACAWIDPRGRPGAWQ
jgi:peptide/nickel transport system permease protein